MVIIKWRFVSSLNNNNNNNNKTTRKIVILRRRKKVNQRKEGGSRVFIVREYKRLGNEQSILISVTLSFLPHLRIYVRNIIGAILSDLSSSRYRIHSIFLFSLFAGSGVNYAFDRQFRSSPLFVFAQHGTGDRPSRGFPLVLLGNNGSLGFLDNQSPARVCVAGSVVPGGSGVSS